MVLVTVWVTSLVTSAPLPLLVAAPVPLAPVFPEWLLERSDSGRSIGGVARRPDPPKWVNPCGGVEVDSDASPASDAKIAGYAVLDVQLALSHVHHFDQRFVSIRFFFLYISIVWLFFSLSLLSGTSDGKLNPEMLGKDLYGCVDIASSRASVLRGFNPILRHPRGMGCLGSVATRSADPV